MAKLSRIDSLDEAAMTKLKSAGITTIEKLLMEGATQANRKEISKKTKISEKLVTRWVNHADFFRIKGIAGHKSELLEAVGVMNTKDLAKANPTKLYDAMLVYNNKKHLVQRVPGMVQVERWVQTAKKIPRIVK
jgi:predicted RecB family nuclease